MHLPQFQESGELMEILIFFSSDLKGRHNGVVYDSKSVSWSGRLANTYTFPKKIDWQTNIYYRGPSENAQSKSKAFYSVSMAFSKDIFKDKGTLTFRLSDVFDTRRRRSTLLSENVKNYSEYQWREPSYTLNFTYRFNQKKTRDRPPGGGSENQGFEF
jgi:hypothetical protein